ncbi:MAG TPA: IS110 family transposase [Gaiellaceae bacterium]|jgi:transposase
MVFVGIDTHKSSLAVCIVDELGRQLAVESFPNDPGGHQRLHVWVSEEALGPRRFGIESSGWLGHGLSLYLLEQGEDVRDVRGHMTKGERVSLRGHGKSDPRDAFAIARVTAREQLAPVRSDSPARDLKLLSDYRDQLCSERTRTQNRLHADLVTLRPGYEQQLPSLATPPKLDAAERLFEQDDSVQAGLARRRIERIREIDAERKQVEREIRRLVGEVGTRLVELVGVGELVAARIIGEVGDINRIPSNRHFASLNGTAPVPASSGQRQRHRLNRAGNRRMNKAIHMMALTQARMDPRARAYVARRQAEGRSHREATRALKRHLSDVIYRQLVLDASNATPTSRSDTDPRGA